MENNSSHSVPTGLARQLQCIIDAKHKGTSSILADMHDIYEICTWYKSLIDRCEGAMLTGQELQSVATELDIQLITHMRIHQKTLRIALARLQKIVFEE